MIAFWGAWWTVHASFTHVAKAQEATAHVLATLPQVRWTLKENQAQSRHDWSGRDTCSAIQLRTCDVEEAR